MATLAEIRQHRQAIADLTLLAEHEIREFLRSLGVDDPHQIAQAVREFVPEVVAAYTAASSTLAADWYDDLRAEAAVGTMFTAAVLDEPDVDEIQAAIGYALTPIFSQEPMLDAASENLINLAGAVVTGADQQTMITNGRRDPSAVRFARHASANACAFCAMLTVSQAVYRSEASASVVVGRGTAKRNDGSRMDARRKGIRPRGTRALGEKFHDNCHCTVITVWPGSRIEEAPYVADWREAYFDATDALGGASDTKAILSRMRETLGISH